MLSWTIPLYNSIDIDEIDVLCSFLFATQKLVDASTERICNFWEERELIQQNMNEWANDSYGKVMKQTYTWRKRITTSFSDKSKTKLTNHNIKTSNKTISTTTWIFSTNPADRPNASVLVEN